MKKIKSIEEIINDYDNFIIDQWGVMHDGTFGYEHAINSINILNSNNKNLFIISQFVRDLSKNVPVLYGLFSIVLALVLGVGAAILRRFLSNLKKKFVYTAPPASQK